MQRMRIEEWFGGFALFGALLLASGPALAGSVSPAMDCAGSVEIYRDQLGYHNCHCQSGQPVCDEFRPGSGKSRAKGPSSEAQMRSMVTQTILDSLASSLLAPKQNSASINAIAARQKSVNRQVQQSAARDAAKRQAEEAAFRAQQARQTQDYKLAGGGAAPGFRGADSGGDLAFKPSTDDPEGMAAAARSPFDTGGEGVYASDAGGHAATPFFGDAIPTGDLRLLIHPENDPRLVDLREAAGFVVADLKEQPEGDGAPVEKGPSPEQCVQLANRLDGYLQQQTKFRSTVLMAQQQVDEWQQANRQALLNQAKDGMEYFIGNYMEVLSNRGKAADRLLLAYGRNKQAMIRNGIDVAEIEARILRLKATGYVGEAAWMSGNVDAWQGFLKDGVSTLVSQLSGSNAEVRELMQRPELEPYLNTGDPELSFLLDISKLAAGGKVFGKWVARQMPLVGLLEISVKTTYNATDWLLSLRNIMQANRINGEVMSSAQSLQRHIRATRDELRGCG